MSPVNHTIATGCQTYISPGVGADTSLPLSRTSAISQGTQGQAQETHAAKIYSYPPLAESIDETLPSPVNMRANVPRIRAGVAQAPAPAPIPSSNENNVGISSRAKVYGLLVALITLCFTIAKNAADRFGKIRLGQNIELVGAFVIAALGILGSWETTRGRRREPVIDAV